MGAFDISRNAFFPAKHYSSVRMQQGRVLTDDDWNEQSRILAEAQRRALTEIVGPFGSPDRGFKITNLAVSSGQANFVIQPGVMYLGGLRLEMEAPPMGLPMESFHTQRDWLQQNVNNYPAPLAGSLGAPRYDLVYLEAWEQGVSAVEDNELYETALAGPDTTTRMRLMRRVKVVPNVGHQDCRQAWNAFCQAMQNNHLGHLNPQMERVVDTRLQVGFTETGSGDDLCTPAVAGRYLGAENQAIRVQLVSPTHFTWGFDNASPYYRVRKINANTLELLDLPKDQHHWPLTGENIELLPWSALLPNGQKVAETAGHHSKITGSYDPDTHRITLANPIPAAFNTAWQSRPDAAAISPTGDTNPLYMRVWNRGSDSTSPVVLPILPGANVLGNTGLTVTFSGNDRVPDDYWIIAVRPETPDVIMPWRLEHTGMNPMGVRTYFAPLAIIRWEAGPSGGVMGDIIHDCRKTFRPLTDLETCCTFHVGDGLRTFGDYDSIEEAVANLPMTGGKICVLPGDHFCNLRLENRMNVTICGCGDQSRIRPHESRVGEPIFHIGNCGHVKIENLSLFARQDRGILLVDQTTGLVSHAITIRNNNIIAVRNGIYILTDSFAPGNSIEIAHNTVSVPNISGAGVGIFCLADDVCIHDNRVQVVPGPEELPSGPGNGQTGQGSPSVGNPCEGPTNNDQQLYAYWDMLLLFISGVGGFYRPPTFLALGGIQLAGCTERASVTDNRVTGGAASGIILGHLPSSLEETRHYSPADAHWDEINRIALSTGLLYMANVGSTDDTFIRANMRPFLYNIEIQRNHVRDMGMAGIGVMCFVINADGNPGDLMVTVENLWINENRIQRCAQQVPTATPISTKVGFGGIVMAQVEDGSFTENEVKDCGRTNVEPICGIYIRAGNVFDIQGNRITNNGPEPAPTFGENGNTTTAARKGARGGIFIALALKVEVVNMPQNGPLSSGSLPTATEQDSPLLPDGRPAAMIHDNIVVQPLGQALYIIGMGAVSVNGNYFMTQDQDTSNNLTMVASTVFILNLGVSKDLMRWFAEPTFLQMASSNGQPWTNNTGQTDLVTINLMYLFLQYLPSGQVLFNDNQVIFDQRDLVIDLSLSATTIISLDDVSFVSNQLECLGLQTIVPNTNNNTGNGNSGSLGPSVVPLGLDYMITDVMIIAASLRTASNRFQEGFTATPMSLFSVATWNSTIGNISSNCLIAIGFREEFSLNIERTLGIQGSVDPCQILRNFVRNTLFNTLSNN